MGPTPIDERWTELYHDLHRHPELSFQEARTAAIAADQLRSDGWEVTTGVGGTGVVGVLRNGDGPTVLLRADMDALPVEEKTGLPYASTVRATDASGAEVPVAHACGHDVHVTCLLAACAELAASTGTWAGTVLAVLQPAEELGAGAKAMVDDGLYERFGTPSVVLGQHVAPIPAGMIGLHAGPTYSASDVLRVVLHGHGGHGSMPHSAVDPVVMAASTVMKLQTVVSRTVAPSEFAVVTVGTLHAGTKANVIPDDAELHVNLRSYREPVRVRMLAAIDRVVRGEAQAAGATREPEIHHVEALDAVVNDADGVARTWGALERACDLVIDSGPVPGSEDVGHLATAAGAPCVFWLLGGADPAAFEGCATLEEFAEVVGTLPANHSPLYAPVVHPTLAVGAAALVAAAKEWLADPSPAVASA